MTFGPRGAYANVGLPGTGLSYRTRLDSPGPARQPVPTNRTSYVAPTTARAPIRTPGVTSIPGTEVEIKSGPVSAMTSPGLGELKQLINEASARHRDLSGELVQRKKALDHAAGRLRWAQAPVLRLFTEKSTPRLVDAANEANDLLEETKANLEGCYVEVDYAFDESTTHTYDVLVSSFESLRTAHRIWDVTATASVDQVKQRTTASSAITRKIVSFDFATVQIIRSKHRAMKFGTGTGRDLQIYPGFAMMRDATRDFALIEFGQLECRLAQSNYIEEESVPADAEQIGATWKRANKDGSRDRRFNDNYQIPILRYGALVFGSPTGLAEAFQISNYAKTVAFANALAAHKRALAGMRSAPSETLALPAPSEDGEIADDGGESAFVAKPRTNLVVDWTLLATLVVGLVAAIFWISWHWKDVQAAFATPPPVVAPAETSTPAPAGPAPHKRRHRQNRVANTAASAAAPDGETTPPPVDREPAATPTRSKSGEMDGLY